MIVLIKQLAKDEILRLLEKVDVHFSPFPLSERVDIKLYSEKLAEHAIHFSVEDDNHVIGMCCCYMNDPNKTKAFLSVICIDPEYVGLGLGKMLMHKFRKHAQINGYEYIELEVHIENRIAIEMYKTLGYFIDRQEKESFYMKYML